jgi:hypothetical protein
MIGYTRVSMGVEWDTRESQVITVCQDIVDSLDEGVGIDTIIINFSKAFTLVPHDRLLKKLAALGVDSRGSHLGNGIPCR